MPMFNSKLLPAIPSKPVAAGKWPFKKVSFSGTRDDGHEGSNLTTYQRLELAHRDIGLAP